MNKIDILEDYPYFCETQMALKFFNTKSQNKRFNYLPRYYDERKERLALKKKQLEAAENLSEEDRKSLLREQFKDSWSLGRTRQQAKYQANYRTLILIGFLIVLGYFVFNGIEGIQSVIYKIMN